MSRVKKPCGPTLEYWGPESYITWLWEGVGKGTIDAPQLLDEITRMEAQRTKYMNAWMQSLDEIERLRALLNGEVEP